MTVIECRALSKRYGEVVAVEALDLAVERGEVFGFLGPNGSGKTTTLRMLLGLIRPSGGHALVNGRAVPDPDGLARIGSMIEEAAFYPWMTGRANLRALALSGPPLPRPDSLDTALERVGLSDTADRKVKAYSQGMRQRLGLAAALMRDPDVLVLDEPTNGMDPAGLREFRSVFRTLADEGCTVMLASHLLVEVERVCDRVAVLARGRLVDQGRVGDLTAARDRVRAVVDAADQQAALRLLADWPTRVADAGVLLVEAADPREVNRRLAGGGVWARELAVARPDLEEAYLGLVGQPDPAAGENKNTEVPGAIAAR